MADIALAEAPTAAPVTTPVTAPPTAQPPISMSFVDKVAAKANPKPTEQPPDPDAATKFAAKIIGDDAAKKAADAKVDKKVEAPAKAAATPSDKKVVDVDDAKIDWKTAPQQFRQSHEKALAKLKELESKAAPKADELPEYKQLAEKVSAKEKEFADLQKRSEELEQTLLYADFEKSPKFKKEFQQPWIDAYTEGVTESTKLSVPLEEGGTRKLTKEEFDSIVTDPDLDSAISKAEDLFKNPTRANQVLEHRRKFITTARAMENAKAEYRTKGAEIEKQTAEQRTAAARQEQALWENHNKEWAEKNPQWMKADEGDEDGAKKLDLGIKAADMAFADTSHLTPEKRAKLFSDTRNRAAAFGHVAHKLEKASARVAELEEKLKQFEDSEPAKGEIKKDAPVAEETFAQRLQKAAK